MRRHFADRSDVGFEVSDDSWHLICGVKVMDAMALVS